MKKLATGGGPPEFVFSRLESVLLLTCLDYSFHRVTRHPGCGIKEFVAETSLDELRREVRQALL